MELEIGKDNTKVEEKDLAGVLAVAGSYSTSNTFALFTGGLKGPLAKYNAKIIKKNKEIVFIRSTVNQIYEYQTERFIYNGLPKGLNKYRLETKVVEHGSALVIKLGSNYYAVNYVASSWDIYSEPVNCRILEPRSEVLNGMEVSINDDNVALIRNNVNRLSIFFNAYRIIADMEITLGQIEKNLTASAPKGIINPKNGKIVLDIDDDNAEVDAMEEIINSEKTFFLLRQEEDPEMANENEEKIFIPIELTDRTDSLLKNYLFLKEQLKELVGAMPNMIKKAERVQNGELQGQDSFASASRQHAFNVREVDIQRMNEKFGTNVTIEYQDDSREEVEEVEEKGDDDGTTD